ncbi:hypothetical protein [Roseibium sp.]|uniref:hypothetical protein n=1 Tax=Roseibium sp. TaxID=1936156 RepID=UPI003D0FBF8F
MAKSDATITFEQMKGAVGSLLLLWSEIERELAESLIRLNGGRSAKPAHGIEKSIEFWILELQRNSCRQDQVIELRSGFGSHLSDALKVRNSVCHGLVGITAGCPSGGEEAHLTVELSGETRILGWSELQSMFRWMSKASSLIHNLTTATLEKDLGRLDMHLEKWTDYVFQEQRIESEIVSVQFVQSKRGGV